MDLLLILVCSSSAVLCCLLLCWKFCIKRSHNRRKPNNRTLVIADFLQPHLVCKPVPCQHPYYRVISEYNSRTYERMPDIEEATEELSQETQEPSTPPEQKPKMFDHTEWYRKFSLTSLPRRYSWTSDSNRKLSSCGSFSSSRRSSDSSNSSAPISPVYKTKPTLVTHTDPHFWL